MRSRALVKRNSSTSTSSISGATVVIGVAVIALIIWLIIKNRQTGKYSNLESWDITYDKDGLPTRIEIHREANRG